MMSIMGQIKSFLRILSFPQSLSCSSFFGKLLSDVEVSRFLKSVHRKKKEKNPSTLDSFTCLLLNGVRYLTSWTLSSSHFPTVPVGLCFERVRLYFYLRKGVKK